MWRLLLYILFLYSSITVVSQEINLEKLLKSIKDPVFEKILSNPDRYKVQIIYSRPTAKGFKDYYYRVNEDVYFYPASLAKLPLCVLTYHKLNELNKRNLSIECQIVTSGPFAPASKYLVADSTYKFLSLKDHIIRSMVVSDNYSPNYLYEFLGHGYIQKKLKQLGYNHIKIQQRFATSDTLQHKITYPLKLVSQQGDTVYQQPLDTSMIKNLPKKEVLLGRRYVDAKGRMVYKPMDFGNENSISLTQLHQMWKEVCYPQIPSKLNLSLKQKEELKKIASMLPNQCEYPNYYHFADNYRKFLFYGDINMGIPTPIKIANKVGLAYGFISDVAYFKDQITGIEFSISAVLYVNDNETLNDGKYEYNS
ncbi:MAG TPA: serine hydrolase, partial [Cytophagales bacterium]|nr:serine hydrolase [Cytophagales bacterium]